MSETYIWQLVIQKNIHEHGLSCKNYIKFLGTAMADVSVVPFKTHHQYDGSASCDVCAQDRKHLASPILWYDVSHHLWLYNFQAWFSGLPRETESSLRSCNACLLPVGSQTHSSLLSCSTLRCTKWPLQNIFPKLLCQQVCRGWSLCSLGPSLIKII